MNPSENASKAVAANPEGYVETVTRRGARGWAWVPAHPEAIVQIEAVLEGRVIGLATADGMRSDLLKLKYGSGRHGFELVFDEVVTGETGPELWVVWSPDKTRLPGNYELKVPGADAPASGRSGPTQISQSATATGVDGYIESMSRQGARGWAWAPLHPDAVVQVEAVLDGKVIGRASADRARPDLVQRNLGTGRYGFAMSFEVTVNGDEAPEFRALTAAPRNLPGVRALPPLESDKVLQRGSLAIWSSRHVEYTTQGPEFEEFDRGIIATIPKAIGDQKPLLLAFYLPQFHAIPENDDFWGKGFTEWRQLARGVSRFPGHYQPRIPRDLGFYDLNNFDTLRVQAELAKAGGIHAFAFYYYWFNGKRVLEKPLERLLKSNLDMPFMILWANENWTRTWDGSESHVLLKQSYDAADEDALLRDLARHFVDPRYLLVDERPLFVIYNPESIPEPPATIARWRHILSSRYGVEPLIFMAQTFAARDPRKYGFDGAIEFPPHKTAEKLVGRLTPDAYLPEFSGQVIRYEAFVAASLNEADVDYPLIKTAVPSWDNEARRPNRGLTLEGLSPAKYEAWLDTLIRRAIAKPVFGTPIVAVNAWNEWAEAAYLEPDVYYGASFLNATARAYRSAFCNAARGELAVKKHG